MPDQPLYTEDRVAPVDRILGLRGLLAESTVGMLKQNMRPALRSAKPNLPAEEYEILQRTIADFLSLEDLKSGAYVAASFGYADLPLGKVFSVVFPKENVGGGIVTRCVLRAVINEWMPIAMDGIPLGHRSVCLFDFPEGIPELIKDLPEVGYPTGTRAAEVLFLCSEETWELRKAQAGG